MSDEFESAERVQDAQGRQYHIGLAPGEVAPWILTVGDPARAERLSKRLDKVRVERRNREFVTFTGEHQGLPLTVMATGIGCDNTEIAVIELCQIVENPCFIRVGTCGALQKDMNIEDLVVSTGSVRLENTSTWFVHEGFPAVAHYEVVSALVAAAKASGHAWHVGLTATGSGFYGAQGRRGSGFEPRFPDLPDQLAAMGVKNLEMETSTLFTLCAMRSFRAGAVCAVFANRPHNRFIDPQHKSRAEDRAIEVALEAFHALANASH
ncbi:MAG: nucleoside phosphorylase [Planctomycetes bacterium]|nr:nucleoside phosphorylase [Planctomycetota bacterium]